MLLPLNVASDGPTSSMIREATRCFVTLVGYFRCQYLKSFDALNDIIPLNVSIFGIVLRSRNCRLSNLMEMKIRIPYSVVEVVDQAFSTSSWNFVRQPVQQNKFGNNNELKNKGL